MTVTHMIMEMVVQITVFLIAIVSCENLLKDEQKTRGYSMGIARRKKHEIMPVRRGGSSGSVEPPQIQEPPQIEKLRDLRKYVFQAFFSSILAWPPGRKARALARARHTPPPTAKSEPPQISSFWQAWWKRRMKLFTSKKDGDPISDLLQNQASFSCCIPQKCISKTPPTRAHPKATKIFKINYLSSLYSTQKA